MRVVGLTGGIASGKTTVSTMLQEKGAAIIDTDLLAREVVEIGMPAYQDIVATFGEQVLNEDRTLDRAALGGIVFADDKARAQLNRFTHPRIRELMLSRLQALAAQPSPPPAAVLVVPLLFENGLDAMVEESWVVAVSEETQLARLIARNGYTENEARARIASQMPIAEKVRRATRVIDNEGDLAHLQQEVDRVWREAI